LKRANQTKELWENLKLEIKISNQREKYKSFGGCEKESYEITERIRKKNYEKMRVTSYRC
jgi:hypothetical protein